MGEDNAWALAVTAKYALWALPMGTSSDSAGKGDIEVLRIVAAGRVQGVGYRYFVSSCARQLKVAGWVRNLPDGRVEAVMRLNAHTRPKMLAQLRRGPSHAQVRELLVEKVPAENCPLRNFEIRF